MASHLWTVHRPQPGVRRPVFRPAKVACHPGAGQERMRRGRIELSGDWPCLCDVTRAVGGGGAGQGEARRRSSPSPEKPCGLRYIPVWGGASPGPSHNLTLPAHPAARRDRSLGPSSPPTCGLRITHCSQTPGVPHGPRVLGNTGFGDQEGAGPLAPGEAQHAVLMVHMGPWPQRTRPAAWCCASGPCSQRAPPPPAWVPGV